MCFVTFVVPLISFVLIFYDFTQIKSINRIRQNMHKMIQLTKQHISTKML